jgi:3-dehydroquinate synthase
VAERIAVNAPGGSYDIVIDPGLIVRVAARPADYRLDGHVAVVTNPTLAGIYGDALARHLPHAVVVVMSEGEQYKTLETVAKLYVDFVRVGMDRSSTVVALGGGVVGDTAGFAAATYMRGVRLVQMPTSLLAMVDSSVGGKVGVDLPQGKNLVGAFKQPEVVLIDTDVLRTLPAREWRCGMAEVIKHGLLADETLLDPGILMNPERAPEVVRRAVQVKVDIVQQDPFEQNVRAYLNLGHTFAHAIEQVSGYNWLHGEAVAVGLLAAAKLSQKLGICGRALPSEVEDILAEVGLPSRLGWLDREALWAAMATDKKWKGGRSRFVLLRDVGQLCIVEDVPKADILDTFRSLE